LPFRSRPPNAGSMRIIHSNDCIEEGAAWLGQVEPRFAAAYAMARPLKLRRFPDGFDRLLSSDREPAGLRRCRRDDLRPARRAGLYHARGGAGRARRGPSCRRPVRPEGALRQGPGGRGDRLRRPPLPLDRGR
jgi:hypothetical protein